MPEARQPAVPEPGASGSSAALPLPVTRTATATEVALVATGAAFVAVCSMGAVALPGMGVPITLQTLGVLLVGAVLGPRRGALAVLLYLAIGFAGLPVFATGRGGLGILGGASAGYLLSFPVAAVVAGWLTRKAYRLRPALRVPGVTAAAVVATVVVMYPPGITVMGVRLSLSAQEALVAGVAFVPGDVIKAVVVGVVATAVLRAFPDLRGRHRP